jgi:hypothetical protein
MGQYRPNRPEGSSVDLKEEALPLGIGLYVGLEPILWQGPYDYKRRSFTTVK